ncbi:uncharacterized protein B0T23DRAFT_114188 [Neurospora hispaniola]|uniref:Uncharacterized protein n=1 Tax=Neurospora hispaniola TaxID=588809 RepID=A0AAJ0MST3_9PEZI|nr:hypothetical protein B0T23DRAFT_114188 [Neurospora hispaniola]
MGEAGDMPRVKDIGRGRGRGKKHLGDKEGELRMRLGWNVMADCTVGTYNLKEAKSVVAQTSGDGIGR